MRKKTKKNLLIALGIIVTLVANLKSGLLREPVLYEQAANEAAEADIVFISAHGQDEPPVSLKLWVEQWLARDGGGPRALAVSLDADAGDSPSLIQMLRELGTAGRLASMDVFLHFGESQTE
jgi:hypothetical protein